MAAKNISGSGQRTFALRRICHRLYHHKLDQSVNRSADGQRCQDCYGRISIWVLRFTRGNQRGFKPCVGKDDQQD